MDVVFGVLRGIREALAITGKELTQALENSSFTQEGRAVIDQTKATWEKQKPQIISGCEKLQIVAGLNILFTILYAFYSRKFSLYNLASIYGCVEFSRACSTLKKHLVKYEALYSYVNKGSLTDQDDKNTLTSLENHFLMALKADLIGKSLIMSLMDP